MATHITEAADWRLPVRRTKLIRPRLGADALARPRLLEVLRRGQDRPLTLLSTPAGYGKTTLACQWLEACPLLAAWLALDARDNALPVFVAEVVAALQTVAPGLGGDTLGLLNLPSPPPPDYLAATLGDELLALPEPLLLVLDDYHVITELPVHDFLATLLDYPPPGLRLALTARIDPPLPLARWRGRDRLVELRAADLRFTADEARAFLAGAAGRPLDPAVAELVDARTEGWATGLRLAALALAGAGDPAAVATAFAGRRQEQALRFLLDEVLREQSPVTQAVLLRTSIVEQVCAPLAEALLDGPAEPGGAVATLAQLLRANLFAVALEPADGGLEWVRYHQLFRELLQQQLVEREGAAAVAALHRRAAGWFLGHELVEEALHHLLAAGEPEQAAAIVEERAHRLLGRDDWVMLDRWLQLLPEDLTAERPALLLARAWTAFIRGHFRGLPGRLAAVEALLDRPDAAAAPEAAGALGGEVDALRAWLRLLARDGAGAAAAARRALERLPAECGYAGGVAALSHGVALSWLGQRELAQRELGAVVADAGRADAYRSRALFALGVIQVQAADLPAARQWMTRYLAFATGHDLIVSATWANCFLGRIAYEWDDLDTARRHYTAAVDERRRGHLLMAREAMLGLALTRHADGRTEAAEALLEELEDLLSATGNDDYLPTVRAIQARLAVMAGDRPAADRWLEAVDPDYDENLLVFLEAPRLTQARVLLARGTAGDVAAAEAVLAAFRARAEAEHATRCVIEALALQALARAAAGDEAAALDHLGRALALAEPGGLVRTFVDLGPACAALLRRLDERRGLSADGRRVLAAFPAESVAPAAPPPPSSAARAPAGRAESTPALVERLTNRELQVLACLARFLTSKEIAAELAISPMTVKRHVGNLCGKFGVASRREAVRRAHALGLLAGV